MTSPHIARPAHHKKRKPTPPPVQDEAFATGHFTALIRRHNWPPDFTPQLRRPVYVNQFGETAQEVAARSREAGLAEGRSYALGTVQMPGTSKTSKPVGWM